MAERYRSLSSWFKQRFGEPVRKITVDAGLGCPNRDGTVGRHGCIYCNPRGSGTGAHEQGISISDQVKRGMERLQSRYSCRTFIAYFQSYTNTYAHVDRLAELYREACRVPGVVGLAVGTRPDCVPDEVLDLFAEIAQEKLVWVEYGVQSVHERTLGLINRGHGADAFFDAAERTRARNIAMTAHLILGLPGESVDDMTETARTVSEHGVQGVKLHPLYVIRGTELHHMMRRGEYAPMTLEDSLDAVFAVLETLPPDIVIHRLTSDPHPQELAAPEWMLDRKHVRRRLQQEMERRHIIQGACCADREPTVRRLPTEIPVK